MARWLKQSTAFTFRIGPFVDSTDGVTAETALTIAQADIQISKNGGAFAQTSASPTTTHDADGWYQCPLTATDTNTLGPLTVQVVMAGALMVWEHFMVVPAAVYDTLVAGVIPMQNNATYGTMQSGSAAGTAVLASATSYVDDLIIGAMIVITGGTGAGQSRIIYDWVSTTDTASVSPNWTTTPDNTSTYIVVPTPPAPTNIAAVPAVNVTHFGGTAGTFASGRPETNTSHIAGSAVSTSSAQIGVNVVNAGGTAWGSGAITAASIATNAITAAKVAADAVTEIQSGLATAAALDTVDNFIDTEVAAILAAVDTEVAAIKAKTDSLTFTVANELDVNVQSINGATVTGDGNATPWDGA